MWPKEKLNKMKTFNSMNPANRSLDQNVLDTFIHHQQLLTELLVRAIDTDLTKIKTAISISKWIRLRLGYTSRIGIYQNLSHIVQADKIVQTPVVQPVMQ